MTSSRPSGRRARMGEAPKSKSGPAFVPQLTSPGSQPKTSRSPGYICRAQRSLPVFRSKATTASVAGCDAPEYVLPVPTYKTPRLGSTVGADQTAPPDGPQTFEPSA